MLITLPQGPVSGGKQHCGCNEVEHGGVTKKYSSSAKLLYKHSRQRQTGKSALRDTCSPGRKKTFLTTFVSWKINYRQMRSRYVGLGGRESPYVMACAKPMQTAASGSLSGEDLDVQYLGII